MRIPLDRSSQTPVYRQIQAFLAQQIENGVLPAGTRLPSSRTLASGLGVNRITVTSAYAELEALGLIYARQGSGYYVAPRSAGLTAEGPAHSAGGDWPLWQQELLSRTWVPAQRELDELFDTIADQSVITFGGGLGDKRFFPAEDFRKALHAVLRRDGVEALGYGERAGYLPLRTTIARILASQGVPATPEHVLITSGSQQALALVAQLFLRPGDVVLVESPTYPAAIDLFRSLDVRLLGVPVDEQGMQVELVEDALRTARPRLVYTIPTFHNPTGTCLSGQRRRQLIALVDRYNTPLLEDDFVGDLRYEGRDQPALKALDPGGRVVYMGTFSKMLIPGLRVGFLVAEGPLYAGLLAYKRVTDLATSSLIQRALESYITVGRYQSHLRRAVALYRQRRDAMQRALQNHFPPGAQWTVPQGGLFFWVRLPGELSANDLFPVAIDEGVAFTPGSYFFPGARVQPYMRLNFAMLAPELIEEGIRRLSRAVDRCLGG